MAIVQNFCVKKYYTLEQLTAINYVLDKVKTKTGFMLTLNITYPSVFSKLKDLLHSIHVRLAPNRQHKNVFAEVPLLGFKKVKLKDILVRAKVRMETLVRGFSKGCYGKRCQICKFVKDSESFESKLGKSIKTKGKNNCNSEMIAGELQMLQKVVCGKSVSLFVSLFIFHRSNSYRSIKLIVQLLQ